MDTQKEDLGQKRLKMAEVRLKEMEDEIAKRDEATRKEVLRVVHDPDAKPEDVVSRAHVYLKFLKEG